MKIRLKYFLLVISIIILGVLSRKASFIPLFIGDLLYAVMMYFIIRFLFADLTKTKSSLISLLLCYSIEIFQLYHANWLIEIRHTLLGRYILGQGFLWSDLIAYTFGILIAYLLDKIFKKQSI